MSDAGPPTTTLARLLPGGLRRPPPQVTLLVAFGGVSLLNYAFGLIAATLLSAGDFGLLGFAQTLLLICGLVLQSGIPWGLTRASVGSSMADRAALARGALVVNAGIAAGLAVAIVLLFRLGPLEAGLERWSVALAVCAALVPFAAIAVARAVAQGTGHFGANAAIQTLEVVGKTGVGLGLAAVGLGVVGAVLGFTAGALLATALGLWFLRGTIGFGARGPIVWPSFSDASPMFGALLGIAIVLNQDLLAVKLLSGGREEAGYYQAAIILANVPYFLVAAALIPVLFTQLARHTTLEASAGPTGRILAVTAIFVVPIEVVLALVPEVALRLSFPDGYVAAAGELRLLAVGNSIMIVVALLSTAFQAVGRAAVPARILLATAATELVALAVVVPLGAGEGAAATFAVAAGVAALALGAAYLRATGSPGRHAVVVWLGRFGLAVLATGLAGVAAHMLGGIVPAILAALATYAVVLWRLGLLAAALLTVRGTTPSDPATEAGEPRV